MAGIPESQKRGLLEKLHGRLDRWIFVCPRVQGLGFRGLGVLGFWGLGCLFNFQLFRLQSKTLKTLIPKLLKPQNL